MSSFAHVGSDNVVKGVYVFYDEQSNPEPADLQKAEAGALAFFRRALPGFVDGDRMVKTCENASLRKNYAGLGDTFDPDRDAFIKPQPAPDLVLDEATCIWVKPEKEK